MEKFPLGDAVIDSTWETLLERHPFDQRTLAETLDGGQAFRWSLDSGNRVWTGIWGANVVRLRLTPEGILQAQSPSGTHLTDIRDYLGLDRLASLIKSLPIASDPVLAGLHARWGGISLLRQPAGETLLAFICSANKQIPQIRAMLARLADRFGDPVAETEYKTLPSWDCLAVLEEAELRTCSLGYRARHVAGTAAFLKSHPGYLAGIADRPFPEAREELMRLPGVGPKVAECVLLFGFGRTEAFPVDTWIARLMAEHYPELAGWNREQTRTFARLHFGKSAGLAQQWLFAERGKRAV